MLFVLPAILFIAMNNVLKKVEPESHLKHVLPSVVMPNFSNRSSASLEIPNFIHAKCFATTFFIISSLKLLLRPGFIDLCESTRKLASERGALLDIYHGRIWKEFLRYNGSDFLVSSYCYALMLNVDWFQPFEHFTYSVGVIYLVLLNLPRAVWYKRENIILVGVIPGPSEPPLNINFYLPPLVSDLLQLWTGNIYQHSSLFEQLF